MTKDRSKAFALGLLLLSSVTYASPTVVAVKYVALRPNEFAKAHPTQNEVASLIGEMNSYWSQCDVRFVLEDYVAPSASEIALPFNPGSATDRYKLRLAFADEKRAVYISTGRWRRDTDPNDNGSNAYSSVPGDGPQGIIFEDWVAKSARLLSHEFGHLGGNLDDTQGEDDLMNHQVSPKNTRLRAQDCERAVTALRSTHPNWLR